MAKKELTDRQKELLQKLPQAKTRVEEQRTQSAALRALLAGGS